LSKPKQSRLKKAKDILVVNVKWSAIFGVDKKQKTFNGRNKKLTGAAPIVKANAKPLKKKVRHFLSAINCQQ